MIINREYKAEPIIKFFRDNPITACKGLQDIDLNAYKTPVFDKGQFPKESSDIWMTARPKGKSIQYVCHITVLYNQVGIIHLFRADEANSWQQLR